MPKSNVNNCSQLVRIFALSSCAFLLSDRTQFCSQTVRNFALGPYAILLVDRTQFCSQTVARTHFCSQTAARTRDLPGHRTDGISSGSPSVIDAVTAAGSSSVIDVIAAAGSPLLRGLVSSHGWRPPPPPPPQVKAHVISEPLLPKLSKSGNPYQLLLDGPLFLHGPLLQ